MILLSVKHTPTPNQEDELNGYNYNVQWKKTLEDDQIERQPEYKINSIADGLNGR